MSVTYQGLIEYLLAIKRPKGGKLCRFGLLLTTIPVFPPNLQVVFTLRPQFGAYANLWYWHRANPGTVPGAIQWFSSQAGMELSTGTIFQTPLAEPKSLWLEVTQASPIVTRAVNVSGLNQFFETADLFLIVDTEEDLKEIYQIVGAWNNSYRVERMLGETNRLLRKLAGESPIVESEVLPWPMATG